MYLLLILIDNNRSLSLFDKLCYIICVRNKFEYFKFIKNILKTKINIKITRQLFGLNILFGLQTRPFRKNGLVEKPNVCIPLSFILFEKFGRLNVIRITKYLRWVGKEG